MRVSVSAYHHSIYLIYYLAHPLLSSPRLPCFLDGEGALWRMAATLALALNAATRHGNASTPASYPWT